MSQLMSSLPLPLVSHPDLARRRRVERQHERMVQRREQTRLGEHVGRGTGCRRARRPP
jgi:hypothetical protein